MTTVFARIARGEVAADKVFQDDRVTAFRDPDRKAPVHILIIPNKVIPTLDDATDDDSAVLGHMLTVARDLARKEKIAQDGYRVVINCREHGGQEVPHLHMHLIGGRELGEMLQVDPEDTL